MSASRYTSPAPAQDAATLPPERSCPPSNRAPHLGIETAAHLGDQPVAARAAQRLHHALVVSLCARAAHEHVVAHREFIRRIVLKQDADVMTKGLRGEFPQIDPADADCAVIDVIEPHQQLDERALPCSHSSPTRAMSSPGWIARERCSSAGSKAAGIGERDVVELDPCNRRGGARLGLGRNWNERLDGEEREVVIEEGRVLVDRNECAGDLSQRTGHGRERSDHEDDTARTDRAGQPAQRNEHIGEGQRCSGDEAGEHRDPGRRAVHLLPLPVQILRQFCVCRPRR